MKPQETPSFSFERRGKQLICWFNNHPLKDAEGKKRWIGFTRECESELEATLLKDFVDQFSWEMQKHFFTEGYNAKKRKEQNWML